MSLRAYVLNEDGVERGYKIGGPKSIFAIRRINNTINIDGKIYNIRPKCFYRRAYRPVISSQFPFFFKYIEFWAIDFRWDSTEPIEKFKRGDAIPMEGDPNTIGRIWEDDDLKKIFGKKGLDIIMIAFLVQILLIVTLVGALVVR